MVADATFEQEEAIPLLPNMPEAGHDYAEELRLFYQEQGLEGKAQTIPEILAKWTGNEEKMMRKLREKYLEGWKGERVALRLVVTSSVLKASSQRSDL
eukprot:1234544-Amphidinium_carterae.1